jgi:hypothetical protein
LERECGRMRRQGRKGMSLPATPDRHFRSGLWMRLRLLCLPFPEVHIFDPAFPGVYPRFDGGNREANCCCELSLLRSQHCDTETVCFICILYSATCIAPVPPPPSHCTRKPTNRRFPLLSLPFQPPSVVANHPIPLSWSR